MLISFALPFSKFKIVPSKKNLEKALVAANRKYTYFWVLFIYRLLYKTIDITYGCPATFFQ